MPRFPDPELWEANRERREAKLAAAKKREVEIEQKREAARQELINATAKEFGLDPSKVSIHFSCRKRMPLP